MKPFIRLLLPGSLPFLLSGCSGFYATSIVSTPKAALPPAGAPSVTLSVSDQRPAEKGGKDPRRVGTIRALAGNGAGMREESPEAVRRLVESATADGLAEAGIRAAPGQSATLEVVVRNFWMDGYASYTAEIEAALVLRKEGKEVWTGTLKSSATGEQPRSPSEMFNRVWGWALDKWRGEIARAAAEPPLAAALGVRSAGPAAPATAVREADQESRGTDTVGLSVSSEFGIDDRQRLVFETRSRDALKKANLAEKHRAFPQLAVRYTASWEKNDKNGKIDGVTVSTRLSLKDAAGRILWEDSFRVTDSISEIDPKETNYLSATLDETVGSRWVPEVVWRLTSASFLKALGR